MFVVVSKLFKCKNTKVVLGGIWNVIPTMSVILFFCRSSSVVYCEGVRWYLHVKYIVYKHMSAHWAIKP